VHEACANIIEHAYRFSEGRIAVHISLCEQPDSIVIDLFDTGEKAVLDEVRPPNLNEPQIKGYGLFLIQQLMDSVEYLSEAEGNHWRLEKKF
jgi:serine/threonine-protein kinase RsbW